mmetsp:Transcript_34035/g.66982  ORF Transcript_34035/g.66982 Transcript_34035/m.66982 type:complete len:114 (+) Transcript_34035:1419-1760(+)
MRQPQLQQIQKRLDIVPSVAALAYGVKATNTNTMKQGIQPLLQKLPKQLSSSPLLCREGNPLLWRYASAFSFLDKFAFAGYRLNSDCLQWSWLSVFGVVVANLRAVGLPSRAV